MENTVHMPWPGTGYRDLEVGTIERIGPARDGYWAVDTGGMPYLLDGKSWVRAYGRTWKYGEFGKLAAEIERVKLERALESL